LKGTDFSPYEKPAESLGLQPLRECEIPKTALSNGSLTRTLTHKAYG
jgi:hypothetical protein